VASFQVLRRAGNYALSQPARQVLYTVVSREDRYKAKNFIDTAVYRAGDQVECWLREGVAKAMSQFNGAVERSENTDKTDP